LVSPDKIPVKGDEMIGVVTPSLFHHIVTKRYLEQALRTVPEFQERYLLLARLKRYYGQNGSSRKNQPKNGGIGTSILSCKDLFLLGNRTTRSDNIYRIDRMFDFVHNIRWNDRHIMVFVHVLDYFLRNPTFIHPGCHE
jgi:hypothetical protein